MTRVAILGAGNGGCAAAADLTRRGFEVSLYSRSEERLAPMQAVAGLHFTGVIGEGFAPLQVITNDLEHALQGAELVMVVTPAVAHRFLGQKLARLLPPDSSVWLNPGSTGGALHMAQVFREQGRGDIVVAETATLTYACRMLAPDTVWIKNEVTNLPFATFPAQRQEEVLARYQQLYPNLISSLNVLTTSLMNLNAILHPPGMIMNAGWIEYTEGDFKFYYHGITPSVANMIEAIDNERMTIADAFEERLGRDLQVLPCIDFFYRANYTTREAWETGSMYQALQAAIPNRPTQSPPSLQDRYLIEDVPFGLVPMVALAEWVEVDVPNMRCLVGLASALMNDNYFEAGLDRVDMGLDQVPIADFVDFLQTGITCTQ